MHFTLVLWILQVDYIELTNFPEHAYYNFTSSAASGELL